MGPISNTVENGESYTPVVQFIQESFKSVLELDENILSDLDKSLVEGIAHIDELRHSHPDLSYNRTELAEYFEAKVPRIAQLVREFPPDFDELAPDLRLLIDGNSAVKELKGIMFTKEGDPRKEKINTANVVKMTLLRLRPVLVYALRQNIQDVAEFNSLPEEEAG